MSIKIKQAANIAESNEDGKRFTITMEEAADILGCTRNSFATLYATGLSKFKKGLRVFFDRDEVEKFKHSRNQFRPANVTKMLPKRKAL